MTKTAKIQHLIEQFEFLPGIGEKTATRLAYFILNTDSSLAERLGNAILDARKSLTFCARCCNFADTPLCKTCESHRSNTICVVAHPADFEAIELSNTYKGRYHILHGVIDPMNGIRPVDIKIKELLEHIRDIEAEEVIIALSGDIASTATELYLTKLLKDLQIPVSRIAFGLGVATSLDNADPVSLSKAIENRRAL